MKYRIKPIEIEAVQWAEYNYNEIQELDDTATITRNGSDLYIFTMNGMIKASKGDFIVKNTSNELFVCKPDIFKLTYEKV